MKPFTGVKIALINNDKIIAIQRDDKPGLRFAGMWDVPGGGRDNDESPTETAQREVLEELGIILSSESFFYQKEHPAMVEKDSIAYFLAAKVTDEQVDGIVFGNEGQGWKLTTVSELVEDEKSVPFLRGRLEDFLNSPEGQSISLL